MSAAAFCRSVLCPAALVLTIASAGCGRPDLVGTWVGRDEQGATVVYGFEPTGTGHESIGGRTQSLRYELQPGYPNIIEITVGDSVPAEVRRGLVRIYWDGRMRLELGAPGGPPPEQLSSKALVLTQPATK